MKHFLQNCQKSRVLCKISHFQMTSGHGEKVNWVQFRVFKSWPRVTLDFSFPLLSHILFLTSSDMLLVFLMFFQFILMDWNFKWLSTWDFNIRSRLIKLKVEDRIPCLERSQPEDTVRVKELRPVLARPTFPTSQLQLPGWAELSSLSYNCFRVFIATKYFQEHGDSTFAGIEDIPNIILSFLIWQGLSNPMKWFSSPPWILTWLWLLCSNLFKSTDPCDQ